MRQECNLAGYVSTNKCAGNVACAFYNFELSRIINSKWQFFALCHSCIQWAKHTHTHTHTLPVFLAPPSYCECKLLSTSTGVDLTMLLQYTSTKNVGNAMIRLCLDLWRKWAWKKCHTNNEECLKQCDTLSRAVTLRVLPTAAVTWVVSEGALCGQSPPAVHGQDTATNSSPGHWQAILSVVSLTEVKEKSVNHRNIGRYRPAPTLRNKLPPLYVL